MPRLVRDVSTRYGLDLEMDEALGGGFESRIIKVRSDDRRFVIRVSPSWRSVAELEWAYELASYAATEIPEALAPLRALDGSLAFEHQEHVVSVFPFVGGSVLDRSNEHERDEAAGLLARLHRVLPGWPAAHPRPRSRARGPNTVPNVDPPGLVDPELDAAVAHFASHAAPALAHGDYHHGNLRCVDHRIIALFDWDDASYWTLENELAWSVWEFAQADDDATLDLLRAHRFLDVYAARGGPVPLGDCGFIIPFTRDDIRTEIREAAALGDGTWGYDAEYVRRSREAFIRLAAITL